MQTFLKVAGSSVCRLQIKEVHIRHLPLLPRLQMLHIKWEAPEVVSQKNIDLSCFSSLHSLSTLHITVEISGYCHQSMLFTGLHGCPCLRAVHVVNGMVCDLPVSVDELLVKFCWPKCPMMPDGLACQIDRFRDWFSGFPGHLSQACVDMGFYDSDMESMQDPHCGMPCLRDVRALQLVFTPQTDQANSLWCCGFFTQLETLELTFGDTHTPFVPVWDLSTLRSLQKLVVSLAVRHPKRLCLAYITGVTANVFEVHFKNERKEGSPRFNFTTWSLVHVSIEYGWPYRLGLPAEVTDTLGALCCMSAVPAITVNGCTPAAAAAAAVNNRYWGGAAWEGTDSDTSDDIN